MKVAALLLLCCLVAACSPNEQRLTVAAGTTLVDSGVMERVEAAYEADHPGVDVVVIAGASGTILALGRSGDADVVVSHAPGLEEQLLRQVPSATRLEAFASEFMLVGPEDGPARGITDVVDAFRVVASEGAPFVSRGDDSGTAQAETTIWSTAGLQPSGQAWYTVTGSGMGFTLQVADQRKAYTLVDRATWVNANLSLVEIPLDRSPLLDNQYSVLMFDGDELAADFARWLAGEDGDAIVGEFTDDRGRAIFRP